MPVSEAEAVETGNSSLLQYCLKWNNHPRNISEVFDRLRVNNCFVDVTLASSDRQQIQCHRVLLSAGSGYLEDMLILNPSDHPIIVLSQIEYDELSLLVEFMYTGEVSVDQNNLARLLEAAKILKIKGLYETTSNQEETGNTTNNISYEEEEEEEVDPPFGVESPIKNIISVDESKQGSPTTSSVSKFQTPSSLSPATKRKRTLPEDIPSSPLFLQHNPSLGGFSSLCGVNDTVYHNNHTLPRVDAKTLTPDIHEDGEIPPLIPPTSIASCLNNKALHLLESEGETGISLGKEDELLLKHFTNNQMIPVRRYKQYSEGSLQQALKDIIDGQSINRSSMKFNIPARTLRDWMKRLNIKSVYTHHTQINQNIERNVSSANVKHDSQSENNLLPIKEEKEGAKNV